MIMVSAVSVSVVCNIRDVCRTWLFNYYDIIIASIITKGAG